MNDLKMDLKTLANGQNATLVVFSFLQADCGNEQYKKAVSCLGKELEETWICQEDGAIECDGSNQPDNLASSIGDILPSVDLHWPGGQVEARVLQDVAAQLREIAARLERSVVDQAARNLHTNVMSSPSEDWLGLLKSEVQRALMQGVVLEQLPQERVVVALSLTLVKKVCEYTPRLLRDLFNTTLQYIGQQRTH